MIEPIILTPIIENVFILLTKYITTILSSDPDKLKKNGILNNPVLSIPTKNTLKIDKYKASLKPYTYKTVSVIVFASPSFNPGIKSLIKVNEIFAKYRKN